MTNRIDLLWQEFRCARLRASLKYCGQNVAIQLPVSFAQPEKIELGSDVSIAAFVHIWGAGGVRIGDRTMIGASTAISSVTHDYTERHMHQTVVAKRVEVGEDVWIGTHAVIMPGVAIGHGAVVGAGSVVTRDVPPMTIVVGTPARVLRKRALADDNADVSRNELRGNIGG